MLVESKLTGLQWNADCLPTMVRQPGMDYRLHMPETKTNRAAHMEITATNFVNDYLPVGKVLGTHETLAGIASNTGDFWKVICRRELESENGCTWWKTIEQTGGGKFPFARYPDIPVIDFIQNGLLWDLSRQHEIAEACWKHEGQFQLIPLLAYLDRCVRAGLPVYRLSHHVETYHIGE